MIMELVNISRDIADKEWLITNRFGSYISSTLQNLPTSKFHGIALSLDPPVKRWIFVSYIQESKDPFIEKFSLDPSPRWNCNIDNEIYFTKRVRISEQKNEVFLNYSIFSSKAEEFSILIGLNSRHFYDLTKLEDLEFEITTTGKGVEIEPSNIDRKLYINIGTGTDADPDFEIAARGWKNLEYTKDKERGDSCIDSIFEIEIKFPLNKGNQDIEVRIGLDRYSYPEATDRRIEKILDGFYSNKPITRYPVLDCAVISTDSFLVKRDEYYSIIAGYHWFTDWTRDSLISLPGLTLVTNRFEIAKSVLTGILRYYRKGLLPNFHSDLDNSPVYNSVDAPLWFIDRAFQYYRYTKDLEFISQIWKEMEGIIGAYIDGIEGIKLDEDYLIRHPLQFTWTDATISSETINPREKGVEIQGLWFNALKEMEFFASILNQSGERYAELAGKARSSFARYIGDEYILDDPASTDIRANQIIPCALDFPIVDIEIIKRAVDSVWKELVTPYGIRTLSKNSRNYVGRYTSVKKDLAYHNGCIWPWLIGPFIKAFLRVYPNMHSFALSHWIEPIFNDIYSRCAGYIPEIYEGDTYKPKGAVAQAWSVAEPLRALIEDILEIKPKI